MIKAIIFDCFGVLAEDGWLPFKRKYIGQNTTLAQEVADLGKQNEYGFINNQYYLAAMAKLIGVPADELSRAVGRKVPNEELLEFIGKRLKPKFKIGLLTNANFDVLDELFTKEQADLFDAAVLSYESKLIKPDPKMYQLIVGRLGVSPEECVYVDDIERYCSVAEDMGMLAVVYDNPAQATEEILTKVVGSL